jgi:hypothetical protein
VTAAVAASPVATWTCLVATRLIAVCLVAAFASSVAHAQPPGYLGFYLLTFDRYGQLVSPYEELLATTELGANAELQRIVIVSYGWATDGEHSLGEYEQLLRRVADGLPTEAERRRTAIIGIGWDSSQTGIRKLANDLMPLPVVADAVAFLPDAALFPLSFWSKAAMADRIGYGGLRGALNRILADVIRDPARDVEIYLIAHSFGARIVGGLIKERVGLLPVQTEPFRALSHVRGALLIQPSLVLANLPQDAPFPVVITQSQHDHANGLLFPLGNLIVNAYSFTAFEALIQNRIFDAVESTARAATGTVLSAGDKILGGGTPAPDPSDAGAPPVPAPPGDGSETLGLLAIPGRVYSATRRTSAELLSIPTAAAFSLVVAPAQYVYTQYTGFRDAPVDHVMDTLAQIPVVEGAVWALERAIGRTEPWGRNGKGLFSVGALHEAAGRLVPTTSLLYGGVAKPITWRELASTPATTACGFPRCEGVVLVDLSDDVGGGAFGDLRTPWIDFTIGWFDLIGTHSAYRDDTVTELVVRLLRRDATRSAPAAASTSPPE